MNKRYGRQTVRIDDVSIASEAAIVGEKEGDGPLGEYFDIVLDDNQWNEKTWEKTESKMQKEAIKLAIKKGGFSPDEIRASAGELAELEGICVQGLMTMAPRGNKDVARRTFAGLRELRDELEAAHPDLNLPELSCGMSEDFEPALEEGSTLVRLGRVVFSPEFAVK